ncbi:hypothetical protein [Paenisporosarcina indica]|uniref:hypothetical protein n=1 Tax=Paenisporosarcina indica TaxID=650093 RepID=UPI00094F7459|nr:hypothetical protein [Paenisporosarcina indica]
MNQVNWNLQEEFYFPKSFGLPCNAPKVEVKPQVEFQQLNGVCSLHGVYHIAANVDFQPGEHEHHGTSEWTSIEDLDLNGETGYFEYAVPLFVELPPTYVHGNVKPEIQLSDVKSSVTKDKTLKVEWNVTCSYEKPQPPESSSVESSSSSSSSAEEMIFIEESPVVEEESTLPFFLRDLKDSYSVYEVK